MTQLQGKQAFLGMGFLILVGCAGWRTQVLHSSHRALPPQETQALWQQLCPDRSLSGLTRAGSRGLNVQKGRLWFQVRTPDFQGQFPAQVRIDPQGSWVLQVTHGLGGPVAQLEGGPASPIRFTDLRHPKKPPMTETQGAWSQPPYAWMPALLRHQAPCPTGLSEGPTPLVLTISPAGEKRLEVLDAEKNTWVYEWDSQQQLRLLHWKQVAIQFLDWSPSRQLLRWEAKSPEGWLKVHWYPASDERRLN